MHGHTLLNAAAIVAGLAWTVIAAPVSAEHRKVVDGYVINVGVVPATQLLRADAYERAMHREIAAQATHHVVVGVMEEKTGAPVGDARVTLEVFDPRGGVQRRTLERGNPGGVPDYSALVRFGWAGEYRLRVQVARAGTAPVTSTFAWTQNY